MFGRVKNPVAVRNHPVIFTPGSDGQNLSLVIQPNFS